VIINDINVISVLILDHVVSSGINIVVVSGINVVIVGLAVDVVIVVHGFHVSDFMASSNNSGSNDWCRNNTDWLHYFCRADYLCRALNFYWFNNFRRADIFDWFYELRRFFEASVNTAVCPEHCCLNES
jgi:hypothetical protein